MSVTPQAPRAGVLPATSHNVSIGAGWAALIFPQVVGLGYGALSGPFDGSVSTAEGMGAAAVFSLLAATMSAVPGLLATIFVGVPLSLIASRLVRSRSSIAINVAAQFTAGTLGGIIVIALFSRLWTGVPSDEAGLLFAVPPIAAAGISAALGWRIALASARRVQRKSQTAGELATENNVRLMQDE